MTFETETSVYHDGEWYDKSQMVMVLPDGTRLEPITNNDDILMNSISTVGQEFTDTDIYYQNPTMDVGLVRNISKHYLLSRILKQIDDFAFNGARIRVVPPEDESEDISEQEIDDVQSKVTTIDNKIIKTTVRMRQATYDSIIYGSAIFERIMGDIEGWEAPVIMKRLPAFSFCEHPIGRMDPRRYVTGQILLGIVYDKKSGKYEYWQKQDNVSTPIQIPTKNVIHIRDEIAEAVDGESFIAKVVPLVRKLEVADIALMQTVHRAGAPLLWIQIKEYRDQPVVKGQGIWTPKKAFEEGKKIAINHGKNNAMVAPDCVQPVPLDYTLPLSPIEVVDSYELRILKALIPRDFLEREGNSISSSGTPTLKLITMIAEGWREKVSLPFIEMWNNILEENGHPGWTIEVEWTDLDPESESEKYEKAKKAYEMGDTFTEDEIREIAGWTPKSEAARKEQEEQKKKAAEEAQKLVPKVPVDVVKTKTSTDKTVKTEKGEPVTDKQNKPVKNEIVVNSEEIAKNEVLDIQKEKERLFIEWAKAAGYLNDLESDTKNPEMVIEENSGNPYHDPNTGRFAEAPNPILDKLSQMANEIGVAFTIDENMETGAGVFTTLDNGALVIRLEKSLLDKGELKDLELAASEWEKENNIPYGASHVVASDRGYDNYAEYIMTHEIGHYKMYKYSEKFKIPEGRSAWDGPKSWEITVQKSISSGWKAPTYYSETDYGEMFAECYSLHEYGYDNMLDPEIVKYIEKVNERWE